MKKIFFFFSVALLFSLAGFWGCEKDFDSVVDFEKTLYQVDSVYSFDSKKYVLGDSIITLRVKFISDEGIKSVYADIYSSADVRLNSNSVVLLDNGNISNGDITEGDRVYSGRFPLSRYYPNGNYRIDYFVLDDKDITKKISVHYFEYFNNQINIPPVLSNLSAPDTVFVGADTLKIKLTIAAADQNGYDDIEFVFFNSFIPPDYHPSQENPIQLYDDGIRERGDSQARDGIFSVIIVLPPEGVTKGIYRWEFQASDRSDALSEKIIHYIVVK
jgi:hypothetical protein